MKGVLRGGHCKSRQQVQSGTHLCQGLEGRREACGNRGGRRSRQRQQQVEGPPDFYDVARLGNNLGTGWLRTMNKKGTVGGEARGKGQAVKGFGGQERTSALSL